MSETVRYLEAHLHLLGRAERLALLRDLQLWVQTKLAEEWGRGTLHNGQPVTEDRDHE